LTDPNPNSPANVEAAKLYQEVCPSFHCLFPFLVERFWFCRIEKITTAKSSSL
jgi:hypothetical protein